MNFSGQSRLINDLKATNSRTILVTGPRHHGKKTLLRLLYAELGLPVYEITGNASDFRESIILIRTQTNPTVYLIPDVDLLNITIQNLLLKVLEEPPLQARFVLTASNYILPTIKSRCVCYMTDVYTKEDILAVSATNEPCLEYADSPGRCELIRQVVNFTQIEPETALRSMMTYIKAVAQGQHNIASVLVKANDIGKLLKERNIPYFTFWLLAKQIYKGSKSLVILAKHLNDLDRYHMIAFYMAYWEERNFDT